MKLTKRILTLLLFVAVATAAGEVSLKTDTGNLFFASRNTASEAQEDTRAFLEASKAKASNHGLGTGARKELSESKEIIKGAESALEGRQNQATQPTMTQHESSTLAKLRAELKDIHKSYTHNAPARSYPTQNTQTTSSEAKRYEAIREAAKNQRKIMATSQTSASRSDDTEATAKQARQERALQEKYDKLVADLGGAGDASEASVQEVVEEQGEEPSNSAPATSENLESPSSDGFTYTEVPENSSAASMAAPVPQEQEPSTTSEQPAFEMGDEESDVGESDVGESEDEESEDEESEDEESEDEESEDEESEDEESEDEESEDEESESTSPETKDVTAKPNKNNSTKPKQTATTGKKTSTATRPSSVRIATRKPLALKKLSTTMAHILESVNRRVVEPVIVPEPLYAYRLQQTVLNLSKEGQKLTDNVSRENKKKWEKEVRTGLENL